MINKIKIKRSNLPTLLEMAIRFCDPLFLIHCKYTKIGPFLMSNCIKIKNKPYINFAPESKIKCNIFFRYQRVTLLKILFIIKVFYAFNLINRSLFSYKTIKYKKYMIYGLYLPFINFIYLFL